MLVGGHAGTVVNQPSFSKAVKDAELVMITLGGHPSNKNSNCRELLNKIYELAKDAGAISGKVSGAGGGGFIFFLVDPAKRMNVIKSLEAVDGRAMSCHFTNHGTTSWKTY